MHALAVLVLALAVLLLLVGQGCRRHSRRFPGPTPWPLLGNVLPARKVWLRLTELSKTYGDIYSLRLLGNPILVLNTTQAARELLDGKAKVYANRPLPTMVALSGMDRGVVFEHDLARLRHARKLLRTVLMPRALAQHRDALHRHIRTFLLGLYTDPERFVAHIRGVTAGITLELSHGYEIQGVHDPYVREADRFVSNFAQASAPGGWIADWVPWLARLPAWFPGMGFKRLALSFRKQYVELAERGHRMVKDAIENGTARRSLTYKALMEARPGENPEPLIMFTATQLYTGGADTSVSTLSSFILLMMQHPEVQARAHAEIDALTNGGTRLPFYTDRDRLPYVDAVMTEVLRLRPAINAIIREPAVDDVHRGYVIEKGTTVIVNFWAMLHDERAYPDPHAFVPERWLGNTLRDENVDPLEVAFGFGRRVCPGRQLAEELLFTTMAQTLALFHIKPAVGGAVPPLDYTEGYTDGGIVFPRPFSCAFEPRTKRIMSHLRREPTI